MLRWFALVIGLAASGCVLGDGIDLPSTSGDGSGPSMDSGSPFNPPNSSTDEPGESGNDMGAPAGSGGTPCCDDPPLGDAGSFGGEAP